MSIETVLQWSPEIPGYAPLELLGEGEAYLVYKVRQTDGELVLAVKMSRSPSPVGADAARGTLSETLTSERFRHPHIVPVVEVGRGPTGPYLASEWMAGGSLAQRLKGRPFDPRDAAEITEILARAVKFAHERGVMHLGLHPSNVLFAADGIPKLSDFSLAREILGGSGTNSGMMSYLAPEQIRGDASEVGAAADLYALGAVLFEMCTGRPPFVGSTPEDTRQQILKADPISPRLLVATVPVALEKICLKCLEKSPDRRYQSADEVVEDLRRFLRGERILARSGPLVPRLWKWVGQRPWTALAGAVAVITALALIVSEAAQNDQLVRENRKLETELSDSRNEAREAADELQLAMGTMSHMIAPETIDDDRPDLAPIREKMLQEALEFYQHFVRQSANSKELIGHAAEAQLRVGDVSRRLGKPADAEKQLNLAMKAMEYFRRQRPQAKEAAAGIARVEFAVGVLTYETDRLKEAEQALLAARDAYKRVIKNFPDEPQFAAELSATLQLLGEVLLAKDQPAESRTYLEQAVETQRQVYKKAPSNPAFKSALVKQLQSLAQVLRKLNLDQEADAATRELEQLSKRSLPVDSD